MNNEFKIYKNDPDDSTSIGSNYILFIYEDRQERLWIGTWGGGLNRFHRDTGTFTRYLPDRNDPSSLSHGVIWDIHEVKNDPSLLNIGCLVVDVAAAALPIVGKMPRNSSRARRCIKRRR